MPPLLSRVHASIVPGQPMSHTLILAHPDSSTVPPMPTEYGSRGPTQLLPKGSDLSGAGSLLAVLATPEVLEAVAVMALLGGMVLWTLNIVRSVVGAFVGGGAAEDGERRG